MNTWDDIQAEDVYGDLPDDHDECLRMLARHGITDAQPAIVEPSDDDEPAEDDGDWHDPTSDDDDTL